MSSLLSSSEAGVARLTLNRPEKRNALDRGTIVSLRAELERCARDPSIRVVEITGAGEVFCAGADLAEMRAQAQASEADNLNDAESLAAMLATLDSLPKPTLARVNGDGYGGALGLIACCDVAVVSEQAKFAFTEVRLGIIPAVISAFVVAKIGERAARRYFLTAETLSASALQNLGLVHEVVPAVELDATCARLVDALKRGAPQAQAAAKTLIRDMAAVDPSARDAASHEASHRLARLRVQAEAQEGFSAFFAKRKAAWRQD